MPTTNSEVVTIDGQEYYQWKAVLRIPKTWTPESGVFIAVSPMGGIANLPAAIKGDNGLPPVFRDIEFTELAYDDPTEASAEWTLVAPATDNTGPVYDLALSLHAGDPGDDGTLTILTAADYDNTGQSAGYVLAMNGSNDGVVSVAWKVGNMYWPTAFTSVSNGTGGNTLGQLTIPAQKFDWRPRCHGCALIHYDGSDTQVDLLARVGNATTGDIAARCYGPPGSVVDASLTLAAAPPAASSSDYAKVAAGGSTTIYFRAEQQGSGTATFDAPNTKMVFSVEVAPIA